MACMLETAILEFLGWEESDEDRFAQDVRIVLVSAEFPKELTTAVMWLNKRDLDIRCIRLKPYLDNGRVLVNVEQVIPLPEAENYIVRIREKEERERTARIKQSETAKKMLRFSTELLEKARARTELHARISPSSAHWVAAGAGISGCAFNYVVGQKFSRVELWLGKSDRAENKRMFDQLAAKRTEIERSFGASLGWERMDDKQSCRIRRHSPRLNGRRSCPNVGRFCTRIRRRRR